jgi:hypothetical protein
MVVARAPLRRRPTHVAAMPNSAAFTLFLGTVMAVTGSRAVAAANTVQQVPPPAGCVEEGWCRTAPSTKLQEDGTHNPNCKRWVDDCPCTCVGALAEVEEERRLDKIAAEEQAAFEAEWSHHAGGGTKCVGARLLPACSVHRRVGEEQEQEEEDEKEEEEEEEETRRRGAAAGRSQASRFLGGGDIVRISHTPSRIPRPGTFCTTSSPARGSICRRRSSSAQQRLFRL